MPALLVPGIRRRLPTKPVKVNQSDPITDGLVFACYVVGSGFYDAVGCVSSVKSGTVTPIASVDGNREPAMHGKGNYGPGGGFTGGPTGADTVAGPFSIFVEGNNPGNGGTAALFRSLDPTTRDGFALHVDDGISFVTNCLFYYSNNANQAASNADALNANSELYAHRIAITANGTDVCFYSKNALNRTVANTSLPNANPERRTSIAGTNFVQAAQSVSVVLVFNRVISLSEYQRLYECPAIVFEPETVPLFWTGVTAQFLRPISDISNSGWTPSSGSDLFAMIGETVRSDATYISATEAGAACEVLLGTSTGDPLSSINHLPRIVMSAGSGGIIIRLKQGATLIKEWTYSSLTGTDTLYEPTLTGGEIDSITDYTDLRLYLETTA